MRRVIVLMSMVLGTTGLFAQPTQVVERFDDGSIKSEYNSVSSELVSVVHFYPSGEIKEKGFFKDGLPEGIWESFAQSGKKIYELSYKDGKRHGEFRSWDLYSDTYTEIDYFQGEIANADRYKKEVNLATISD